MANKLNTNEKTLKNLIKDLSDTHPFYSALLVERLQKISQSTRKGIAVNPESFDNRVLGPTWYISLCDKIDHHLGIV